MEQSYLEVEMKRREEVKNTINGLDSDSLVVFCEFPFAIRDCTYLKDSQRFQQHMASSQVLK